VRKIKYTKKKCLKLFSEIVKLRDGNSCQVCGKDGKDGKIDVHHIISSTFLPFELWNGICLCPSAHSFGSVSFHKNPVASVNWLQKNKPVQYKKIKAFKYEKKKRPNYKKIHEQLTSLKRLYVLYPEGNWDELQNELQSEETK